MRPAEEGEEPDEPEDNLVPPGICGVQGCPLPDGHLGLCQVKICSSRRQSVQEKTIIQEQMARYNIIQSRTTSHTLFLFPIHTGTSSRLFSSPSLLFVCAAFSHSHADTFLPARLPNTNRYQEIQASKEIQAQVELARADTLRKAEDQGVIIKAPRGNKTQWHANFKLDEFVPLVRDVPIVQRDGKSGDVLLRGVLNIGPGHTVADGCKMLLTELQMAPIGGEPSKHANDSFPHCFGSLSLLTRLLFCVCLFAHSRLVGALCDLNNRGDTR